MGKGLYRWFSQRNRMSAAVGAGSRSGAVAGRKSGSAVGLGRVEASRSEARRKGYVSAARDAAKRERAAVRAAARRQAERSCGGRQGELLDPLEVI